MPELPEVETIKKGLATELIGQKIVSVDVRVEKLFFGEVRFLIGHKVLEIERRAKIIIWKLDNGFLIFHLKMTGQLIYQPKNKKYQVVGGHPDKLYSDQLPHKYSHIIFEFEKGFLYFNDLRKFGWVKVIKNFEELKKTLAQFGPEYDWPEFSLKYFMSKIGKRNVTIKQALLDQALIAGLGNIYSDEILFCAKVHPKRKATSLTDKESLIIYSCIPKVLKLALEHGGTSSRDYRKTDGSMGTYLVVANVYGREGQPCKICDTPIERTKIGSRSSHFCPKCQK